LHLRTLSISRVRMYLKKKKKKVDSEHLSGSLVHEVAFLAPPDPEHLSGSLVLEKRKKKKLMSGASPWHEPERIVETS
jgi:hypothetical protein